ncbi:hypothetical protein [Methylocystis sp. B8]|uniref:hypothetical protein n=1 Tax=Methylocystis sp. B8 TaxID=544938 RepID=UPI0010FF0D49|nr:hypothetical protein [Methylocystis sp. B8]TLG75158.1 hypothetical protein FEV16_11660 [Methylocystis sp. B8]
MALSFNANGPVAVARSLSPEEWKAQASFALDKDAADKLPAGARAKFLALRNELAEARAVLTVPREKLAEAREKRDKVRLRLESLRRNGMHEGHPAFDAEKEVFDRLSAEVKLASDEYSRRSAAIGPIGEQIRRLEAYTASLPLSVGMAPAVAVKLPKGASIVAAIVQAREKIQEHRDAIQAAIDAPCTSADVKKRMRAQIEELAESGRPSVQGAVDFGERIKFPTTPAEVFVESKRGHADVSDAIGLVAWLFKDQLIAALDGALADVADDASALTADERRRRVADAKKQLLEAERIEEALIEQARQSGLTIGRRHDADPRAILQLSDSAPEVRDD